MKGKERAVTGYRVGAVDRRDARQRALELPLVGREAELAALRDGPRRRARAAAASSSSSSASRGSASRASSRSCRRCALGFQQLDARCEPVRGVGRRTSRCARCSGRSPGSRPRRDAGRGRARSSQPFVIGGDARPRAVAAAARDPVRRRRAGDARDRRTLDPAFRRERLHEVVEQFLDARAADADARSCSRTRTGSTTPRASSCASRRAAGARGPGSSCATRRPEGDRSSREAEARCSSSSRSRGGRPRGSRSRPPATVALAERSVVTRWPSARGGNPLFVRELVAPRAATATSTRCRRRSRRVITARIDTLEPERPPAACATRPCSARSFDLDAARRGARGRELEDAGDLERWDRLGEFVARRRRDELALPPRPLPRRRVRGPLVTGAGASSTAASARRSSARAGADADERRALLSLHFFEAGDHEKAWRYCVARRRSRAGAVTRTSTRRSSSSARSTRPRSISDRPAAEIADGGGVARRRRASSRAATTRPRARTRRRARSSRTTRSRRRACSARQGVVRERMRTLRRRARDLRRRLLAESRTRRDGCRPEIAPGARARPCGDAVPAGQLRGVHRWSTRCGRARRARPRRPARLAHAYYLLDIAHDLARAARRRRYRDSRCRSTRRSATSSDRRAC